MFGSTKTATPTLRQAAAEAAETRRPTFSVRTALKVKTPLPDTTALPELDELIDEVEAEGWHLDHLEIAPGWRGPAAVTATKPETVYLIFRR